MHGELDKEDRGLQTFFSKGGLAFNTTHTLTTFGKPQDNLGLPKVTNPYIK
jgi:hypothetical protein